MKAFRTYMDLIFKLISFKNHNPEYAKQIEKALPILADEEIIAAGLIKKGDAANVFKFVNKEEALC